MSAWSMRGILVLCICMVLPSCGENEVSAPAPIADERAWLLGDWEGGCYQFQLTQRQELWHLRDPGATQHQYYCGSTHLIYTPRAFASWRITGDTLRFELASGTEQIVKFRIDTWGGAADRISMYKIVDTGWAWVAYRRAQ